MVHLAADELDVLRAAGEFNWRQVEPQIFGSLLEGALGHDKQWELGAHYTHEADIQKVVQPTIVRPWRERIENLASHVEAQRAQSDLLRYVVLDPACGSGNFLYVAYRELRRLEHRLQERERELRRRAGQREQGAMSLFFPLQNIRGIEIDPFAIALARVTCGWVRSSRSTSSTSPRAPCRSRTCPASRPPTPCGSRGPGRRDHR